VSGSVVVIGGGAIGLATAYALVASGRTVTIVERSRLGSGAATGNAGEVCPTELSPLAAPGVLKVALKNAYRRDSALFVHPRAALAMAPFLTHLLRSSTPETFRAGVDALTEFARPTLGLFEQMQSDGVEVGLRHRPYVNAYSSRAVAQERREYKMRTYPEQVGELVDGHDLRDLEPVLSAHVRAGFLTHGHAHLDPGTYVASLTDWLRRHGVRVLEGAQVTAVDERPESIRVRTSAGDVEADHVVVTAGVGTREVLRLVGIDVPIAPGKGYSFTVAPTVEVSHVIKLEEAYVAVVPMDEGVRLAGTMEFDPDPDRFNHRRVDAIVAAASPFLSRANLQERTREWVGARPMTSDGLPIVGRVTGKQRLFVAAGHNMLGLLLSPVTGQAVVGLLDGRPPATIAPFRLDRFPRWLASA
jgi:D-amino-acid dehydrogenase